jgi:hypothetical protein
VVKKEREHQVDSKEETIAEAVMIAEVVVAVETVAVAAAVEEDNRSKQK